jgi:hypothetical protein
MDGASRISPRKHSGKLYGREPVMNAPIDLPYRLRLIDRNKRLVTITQCVYNVFTVKGAIMKLAKRHMEKIEHLGDERNSGNGWLVTLKPGWCIDPIGKCHVFGEDTIREVSETMGRVRPCKCSECAA